MKRRIFPRIMLLFFLCQVSTVWAIPDTVISVNADTTLTLSGAADSQPFGYLYSLGTGSRSFFICNSRELNYDLGKVEYTPLLNWTGNMFQSTPAHPKNYLYESGVAGLNLVAQIRSDWFNNAMTGSGVFNSMIPYPAVVWTGTTPNAQRIAGLRAFHLRYLYRGADRIANGNQVIPGMPYYRYTCFDRNNVAQETTTVRAGSITVRSSVTGCTPDSKTATVNMPGIPVARIENAASSTLIGTQQQTFSLRCDPNIFLSYAIVDLNDPTNTTTTSTLTPDSTATGVGYALTRLTDGMRLQFGPDGSAVGIPGQTKYLIDRAGTAASNPVSHGIGFSYVRKPGEALKTGSAKSLIGITYTYQ